MPQEIKMSAEKLVPDIRFKTKCKSNPMCTCDIQYGNINWRSEPYWLTQAGQTCFSSPQAERNPEELRCRIVKITYYDIYDSLICVECEK